MKHSLPPLDSFKAFEATARLMSFTRAAEELCVSKGAVSYQVKKLENHLGQVLFKRTTRQILLTDGGQVLLQQIQHWFTQLNSQLGQLKNNQDDTLTIAVTTYTAVRWLSPRLAIYRQNQKQQIIILQHSVNETPPRDTSADVSIRWQYADKYNDHFIPAPLFPVISTKQAALLPQQPLQPGQLHQPPWQQLHLLCEPREANLWYLWNNSQPISNTRQVIEDANVRVQAAIDGSGIILADHLMQAELDAGLLVELSSHCLQGVGYGIKAHSAIGKRFVAWLMEESALDSLP